MFLIHYCCYHFAVFYKNLKVRLDHPFNVLSSWEGSQNPTTLDPVQIFTKIKELLKQSSKNWVSVTDTPQGIEYCEFTPIIRENAKVVKSVHVDSNLQWQAQIHSIKVPWWLLATREKVDSVQAIVNILDNFENLQFCSGLTNPSYNSLDDTVYNTKREIVGKTESIRLMSGGQEVKIKRALACFGVAGKESGGVCSSCRGIKNTLDVGLHRLKHQRAKVDGSSSKSYVNWRFLGDVERRDRERDERRRRVNAERREVYAKRKSIEEKRLKKLSPQDHKDMEVIFKEVDAGCDADGNEKLFPGDPNASFFWSFQRELLEAKQPKWHPR